MSSATTKTISRRPQATEYPHYGSSSPRARRWKEDADPAVNNVIDLRAARRQQQQSVAAATPAPRPVKPAPETVSGAAPVSRAACPPAHWGLIFITLFMALFSIPMIYSASQAIALDNHGSADFFLIRQIGFVLAGIGVMVGISRVPPHLVRGLVWCMYFGAVVGLLATKFSPLGVTMGGVERWLKVGPVPLQVSEIAKFALIGVLADFWSRAGRASYKSNWPWFAAFGIAGIPLLLVFMQPHLSATLVLFTLPLVIGFYAGVPGRQIFTLLGSLVVLGGIVMALCSVGKMPGLKPYQQERIAHFFAEETDETGAHYQTEQGLRAIERGGLTGVGFGNSLFKQGHLPAPHTDFILAIVGEEVGLAGMLVLLVAYGAMIFFCFHIGYNATKQFETLLCVGVGSLLALQVVCNLGVVLDVLPVTGMPLPFVSYGGSGLLCTLLGIGLVLGISRNAAREEPVAAATA